MEHSLLLFGDNICESKSTMDYVRKYNELFQEIRLEGSPALPIYRLRYNNVDFIVECRGRYENWDLPKKVSDYIGYFDKPDVVLYDVKNDKIIAAAEFTETVSVGNSQWQRSGRAVASAILEIPFLAVYPAVGEDRSQKTLREPTALLTEFFLKLSLEDLNNPTLLLLRDDPYVQSQNRLRKAKELPELERPNGNEFIGRWFSLRIIYSFTNSIYPELKKLEKEILLNMFKSLNEPVKLKGKNIITRIEKDLPYWNKYFNYPSSIDNLKKHTLMEISKIDWSGISGKDANESYFSNVFLNKLRLKCKSSDLKTYVEGGKHCMLGPEYTPIIEKLIMELYPPHLKHSWGLGSLKYELPTIFIPLEIWQRKGLAYSDPNAGEAVAFPAMFDFLHGNKANILYFAYGIPHPKWYEHYLKNKSKVWRAINILGDILCVDNKIDNEYNPISIKIKNSNNKKF